MRKRRCHRHPDELRRTAVERWAAGELLEEVARDLDLHKRLIQRWRWGRGKKSEKQYPAPNAEDPEPVWQAENQRLKALLADRTLELDFFRGALHKIEARRQPSSKSGETASSTKSGR
jgi:transposase-like protein